MSSHKEGITWFRRPNTFDPVLYVGRNSNTTGVASGMMPHSHPEGLEICYVTRGHLEWWTGGNDHQLRPLDLLVTPPHVAHGAVDSAMQPNEYYWVHVRASAIPDDVQPALFNASFQGVHRGKPEIGELVQKLFLEHAEPDEHSATACRALVSLLLVALARGTSLQTEPSTGELVRFAQEALLEEEFERPSVKAVADKLGVSTVWLTRLFRLETGESPAQWVRGRKLSEARKLLAMEDAPVSEIAVRLGFSSSQYFATVFRRETGMSPTEYRELRTGYVGV